MPSLWSSSARNRCSGVISVLPASRPSACAACERLLRLAGEWFGSTAMTVSSLVLSVSACGRPLRRSNRATTALRTGTSSRRYWRCAASTRCSASRCKRVEARLELGDALACAGQLVLEREDALHARERHAVVGELLDPAQQRDVVVGVAPAAAGRARRRRAVPCARRCAASAGAHPRARPRPRSRTALVASALHRVFLRSWAASRRTAGTRVVVEHRRERLDRFALRAREVRRDLYVDGDEQVAARPCRCRRRPTPLPRTRSTLPLGVPGGIRTVTGASSVGTFTSAPSAASGNVTGSRNVRSLPLRPNSGCSRTCTTT